MSNTNDKDNLDESSMSGTDWDARKLASEVNMNNPVFVAEWVNQLWWNCADIQIYVISPHLDRVFPAIVIEPEPIEDSNDIEFVYPIHDMGYKVATSKGTEMFSAGMSMCKLYYTIEKMIRILLDRLKAEGIDAETEVQVAFGGHELAQRKAFESIINLNYNFIVTNFVPGAWGDNYLVTVKTLAENGFGYPSETPRESYKKVHSPSAPSIKR